MAKLNPGKGDVLSLYKASILARDRVSLSKAITLAESSLEEDRLATATLIDGLLPHTGKSVRIGITGSPGVGKSTFIESFGKHLTSMGKHVAILTVDPTSQKTKGSILGDKTRMEALARDPLAFIRPSPSGDFLGGVTAATRESILLCEAAGFEVIIIETVGVGQSEVAVREMVDFFLLLMLAGAGDELQGIKKGIMEMADGIVVTKSDGDNVTRARQAQIDLGNALHLFQPSVSGQNPEVLITSAIMLTGIDQTWEMIASFATTSKNNGHFARQRSDQNLMWFRSSVQRIINSKMLNNYSDQVRGLETRISKSEISPVTAIQKMVELLFPRKAN